MRLLSFQAAGGLKLEKFDTDDLPPYAILSHTWGQDEVSLPDLQSGHTKEKDGYNKIIFCGKQAARDGLRYFWVDTCCIDKQDSAELSESLNSMFQWYRKSSKCYAYLSDVTAASATFSGTTQTVPWANAFRRSRWFTRGWTLQELLAPPTVIFYSSKYKELGDKTTLANLIQEATSIPLSAISGQHLDAFSTAERISWAKGRQTKRPEDVAYCLFGIFDVFCPAMYGEGQKNALQRLQEAINQRPVSNRLLLGTSDNRNLEAGRFNTLTSHFSRGRAMKDSTLQERNRHLARVKRKSPSFDQYKASFEGFFALIKTQQYLGEAFLRDTTELLQLLHDGSQRKKFSNSKRISLLDEARRLNVTALAAADGKVSAILLSKMRFEAGVRQVDRLVLHCAEAGRSTSGPYLGHQADEAIGTMSQALKGLEASEDYELAKEIEQECRVRLRNLLSHHLPMY